MLKNKQVTSERTVKEVSLFILNGHIVGICLQT